MMGAVASRYGRGGSFWKDNPDLKELPIHTYEVWNEPNHGAFWCPAPDPAAFAEFLVQSAETVRDVDPEAEIMLGGLAPFHESVEASAGVAAKLDVGSFVRGLLDARPDLDQAVDTIGIHTYGDPTVILNDIAWYRANLDSLGLEDVPMSLNEVGWPTIGSEMTVPVPEETRAAYMEEIVPASVKANCDIVSLAPHTWVTEETDPNDPEEWFGIAAPATGSPYPSATTYFAEVAALQHSPLISASQVSPLCA
jgi:hypothetical protein